MLKSKLCGLAIASMIGCVSLSPMTVLAAETTSESVTLSERNKEQRDNKSSFDEIMKAANEKWATLTNKQKTEVYNLLEKEMKAEIKLLDKLVDLDVLKKEDVAVLETRMREKLDELRKSGEFPLVRPKPNNKK